MSFRWHADDAVAIDDLVDAILDELKDTGGWTETDAGYDVVTDPNGVFDLYVYVEATNNRFLQFELGEAGTWNIGTHTMGTPIISWGHLIADTPSGHPAGTEEGTLKMSYDDTHVIIMTDYTANGAAFRRCLTYAGLADPLLSTDEVLTGGSTLFRGSNAVPTNDETTAFNITVMRDISAVANKPTYAVAFLNVGESAPSSTNYAPDIRIMSALLDQRHLPYFFLTSDADTPTGGEDAGNRATFFNMFCGGNQDTEAYGSTIKAKDGKVYYYFQQATTLNYTHICSRVLVRQA